jgi:hypothetical protein
MRLQKPVARLPFDYLVVRDAFGVRRRICERVNDAGRSNSRQELGFRLQGCGQVYGGLLEAL